MKKILVPVDFSPNSMNALRYAFQLFDNTALEVTLLHTYEANTNAFYIKSMDTVLAEDAQEQMDDFLRKLEKEQPKVTFQPKIVKGSAVSKITTLGDSGAYDYIVMGTKGASGLKKVFIGSVAGGVIAKTEAPVIIVPADYGFRPVKEILLAVGKTPYSGNTVLDPLRKMVKLCQANVNVVHISEEEAMPDIKEQIAPIEDLSPSINFIYDDDDINDILNEHIAEGQTDMLCLVRTKRGFLGKLFDESVTTAQTFNSPVPLMVLHN